MKQLSIPAITAFLMLAPTTVHADEKPLHAKLVKVAASAHLDKKDRALLRIFSNNTLPAISITFLAKSKNIIEIKKDSLVIEGSEGWKMASYPRVDRDGETVAFTVEKGGNFLDKIKETKVKGTVDILTATKLIPKSFSLLAYDEPLSIDNYTFTLLEDRLEVKGNLKLIKEITVEQNEQMIPSRGSSSSNDTRTYMYKGIGKGAKISLSYWDGVAIKKVHFSKK